MGTYKKVGANQHRLLPLDWTKKRFFFKPKLFDVCANFTKVGLEIRARVISQGLIIFLRRSEVSDPSWSGPTFVPAYECCIIGSTALLKNN